MSKPMSKSQKRLLIILALMASYAVYDRATARPKPMSPPKEIVATGTITVPDQASGVRSVNPRPVTVVTGWRRDPFRKYPEAASASFIGKALQKILLPKLTDLELTAISHDGRQAYALINDQIVTAGESIHGYRVVDIRSTDVVLKKDDFTFTLSLPEEETYE